MRCVSITLLGLLLSGVVITLFAKFRTATFKVTPKSLNVTTNVLN